jgi:hypothetical protein
MHAVLITKVFRKISEPPFGLGQTLRHDIIHGYAALLLRKVVLEYYRLATYVVFLPTASDMRRQDKDTLFTQ